VDAATLLYLDPTGFDAGSCTQAAPCRTLKFAFSKATSNRYIVSMATGNYTEAVDLLSTATTSTRFEVRGHNSTMAAPTNQDNSGFVEHGGLTKFTVRDLNISQQPNTVIFGSPAELDNVTVQGAKVSIGAGLTANHVAITNGDGIDVHGLLAGDGLSVTSTIPMFTGLYLEPGASINLTNLVVAGAGYQCVTLSDTTSGTISFASITDCGTMLQSGPAAVSCSASTSVAFQSSIIWSPGSTFMPMSGCNFAHMIIGPPTVTGASSSDPQFVNPGTHDLHLRQTSPAVDMIDAGPATDIAGTARPQGPRFDLGAYEYAP